MKKTIIMTTMLLASLAALHAADLKLAAVFTDHAVLQREAAVPVWGWADADAEVKVDFAGQTKTAKADATGKWMVKLDPLKTSAEPQKLTVTADKSSVVLNDILVGEVWLGSGQSNMAGPVRTYKANDEGLRETLAAAPYPHIRLITQRSKGWQLATAANVDAFSAILFAFGSRLQKQLEVPVGLMVGAVGGTPSGFWLTEDMYRGDAACMAQVKKFAATYDFAAAMKGYERYMTAWKASAEKAKQTGARAGREPTPPKQAGECIGEIGHLYTAHVQPYVPYAIRGVLWDQGEGGTGITGVDQHHVMGALIQGWRKAWGQDFPFLYMQKPSGGGTAWDLANPTTKNASPFTAQPARLPTSNEGIAREVHLLIQQHPKTAMVISTDLGGMTHPSNKSGYADRALLVAKGFVYGQNVEFSGPVFASHEILGDKVRVSFTHTGQGLAARHSDKLQGFLIAGPDKQFVWADATIEGNTVLVSSPSVPAPAAVRYAWSSSAPWANLFNKDGLPAQTFRTDVWDTNPLPSTR